MWFVMFARLPSLPSHQKMTLVFFAGAIAENKHVVLLTTCRTGVAENFVILV